jgi:hypothetical protein
MLACVEDDYRDITTQSNHPKPLEQGIDYER